MAQLQPNQTVHPITIVIATLGGATLWQTLDVINRGSFVPEEILICIPRREAGSIATLCFWNVRVVITECCGQVAQRAEGFRHASHDVVVQMDDDLLLDERCIEYLLQILRENGPDVAIAPSLVDIATGRSVYRRENPHSTRHRFYQWLMNGSDGYAPGKIDKSGTPVGIDPEALHGDWFDVEWLAGGCVMHHRQNLVLENYFPFAGKAFCEDIIHSHLLKAKGIRLLVDRRAICRLEVQYDSALSATEFCRNLRGDYRARSYFMKLSARRRYRMVLFYVVRCATYLAKRVLGARSLAAETQGRRT